MTNVILIGILATIIIRYALNHQRPTEQPGNHQYSILIQYNTEDNDYIATCPELGPGISAFGPTRQTALNEIHTAINLTLATHKKHNKPLPTPNTINPSP